MSDWIRRTGHTELAASKGVRQRPCSWRDRGERPFRSCPLPILSSPLRPLNQHLKGGFYRPCSRPTSVHNNAALQPIHSGGLNGMVIWLDARKGRSKETNVCLRVMQAPVAHLTEVGSDLNGSRRHVIAQLIDGQMNGFQYYQVVCIHSQ